MQTGKQTARLRELAQLGFRPRCNLFKLLARVTAQCRLWGWATGRALCLMLRAGTKQLAFAGGSWE